MRFTAALSRLLHPHAQPPSLPIGFEYRGQRGSLDRVEGAPLPLVRVFGWYAGQGDLPIALTTSKGTPAPLTTSRYARPDVVQAGLVDFPFSGFRADFLLSDEELPQVVTIGDAVHYAIPDGSAFGTLAPHYAQLFTRTTMAGRNSIYGSGPPTTVAPEFKAFARLASGRTLDFGSGSGDLVGFLRGHGIDAVGLELDEARISNVLSDEISRHVTLYPGDLPLPFADATFDSIVSTEVIEHITGVQRYVPELARILKPGGKLLVTTPDITSIPSSFPANCVPWHLLEATHVNFFTPQSVAALFAAHFDLEQLFSLGTNRVNGFFVPGSIGAVFRRRS